MREKQLSSASMEKLVAPSWPGLLTTVDGDSDTKLDATLVLTGPRHRLRRCEDEGPSGVGTRPLTLSPVSTVWRATPCWVSMLHSVLRSPPVLCGLGVALGPDWSV